MIDSKKNYSLRLFDYKEKFGKFKIKNEIKNNLIGKFLKKEDCICFIYSEEIVPFIKNSLNFDDFENESIEENFPEIYELQKKFLNSYFFTVTTPSNLYEEFFLINLENGFEILKNIKNYENLVTFIQKNNLISEFSETINFYFKNQKIENKKDFFLNIFEISNDLSFTKKICSKCF